MVGVSESRAEHEAPEVPADPSPDASSSSGPAGGGEVSTENSTEVSTKTSATPDGDTPVEDTADGDVPGSDVPSSDVPGSDTTASGTPGADTTESDGADAEASAGASAVPARLTFRITPISLLAVLTVAICVTPVAWYQPWLLLLYLLPAGLLVWIFRVRTVVTADSITATALGRTRIPWDDVRSVKLDERRWVRAVLDSGKEVLLPAVRVRDLPRLAAMSGGRLPDPAPPR